MADRAARVIEEHGPAARRAIETAIGHYGPRVAEEFIRAYERHGKAVGDRLARAFERHGPKIRAALEDPGDLDKVLGAALAVMELKEDGDREKKRITYEALRAVGRIEVETDGGTMTIEGLTRSWIRRSIPCLERSSVVEDPAEFVTYGLIYQDGRYLFGEMRILDSRRGRGKVSLRDALVESSGADPDRALEVIGVMQEFEALGRSLREGDRVRAAADAFQRSLGLCQRAKAGR